MGDSHRIASLKWRGDKIMQMGAHLLDPSRTARPRLHICALPNPSSGDLPERLRKSDLFGKLPGTLLAHVEHLSDLLEADEIHVADRNT